MQPTVRTRPHQSFASFGSWKMETNVHLKINVHIFISSWLKVVFVCFLFFLNKNVNKAGLMIVLSIAKSNAALGKGSGWILSFAAAQVVGSSFCWDLFGCGACPMTACVWGERATESFTEEKKDSTTPVFTLLLLFIVQSVITGS